MRDFCQPSKQHDAARQLPSPYFTMFRSDEFVEEEPNTEDRKFIKDDNEESSDPDFKPMALRQNLKKTALSRRNEGGEERRSDR